VTYANRLKGRLSGVASMGKQGGGDNYFEKVVGRKKFGVEKTPKLLRWVSESKGIPILYLSEVSLLRGGYE